MEKNVLDFVVTKTHDLMNAVSCSAEAKKAAEDWLSAVGTDKEKEQTQKYIAELEADIMPIDGLIDFAKSEMGAKVFGEKVKDVLAHAESIKAAGAKFCDCPACTAVAAILTKKDEMLK